MAHVVLGLGANLGDREAALQSVIDAMAPAFTSIRASRVHETAPWGVVDQPPFLNAVVAADTAMRPSEVLAFAQECEAAAHRTHDVRWGPRTLDVDVIAYDDMEQDDPMLTLPHPRAHLRAFVIVPLLEVEPDFFLRGHGYARDLLRGLDPTDVVVHGELRVP